MKKKKQKQTFKISIEKEINVLSLGAGVQSSALLMAYYEGKLKPMPDFAIFADTQAEPEEVYKWLKMLQKKTKDKIPVIIASDGDILNDEKRHKKGFTSVPLFSIDENGKKGMGMRQCTNIFKIQVVHQAIRKELGYVKYAHMKHKVNVIMGISTDEIFRMKDSRVKWIVHKFPLIDELSWKRQDCIEYVESLKLGTPPRSACVMCPYKKNDEWKHLKDNFPKDWQIAVDWDEKMRNLKPGVEQFVHRSCVPLKDADLESKPTHKKQKMTLNGAEGDVDVDDISMDDECDGICGV